ncbi:hypothetical protein GIY23_12795 [Allosaccharopolyspora coralli]|uniref:Uncharacterized protein n=1 Tax=Allosaccharopolyspora coralli TaxID=2665642 RepID=A0A5Q3Q7F8_9PSEU|nr:hypothetical protein [Allosaccharopolyspora coralli]QGK70283.1 hypothetical protein GIY23_12795 [Allosaccharopolyspora coralli]
MGQVPHLSNLIHSPPVERDLLASLLFQTGAVTSMNPARCQCLRRQRMVGRSAAGRIAVTRVEMITVGCRDVASRERVLRLSDALGGSGLSVLTPDGEFFVLDSSQTEDLYRELGKHRERATSEATA